MRFDIGDSVEVIGFNGAMDYGIIQRCDYSSRHSEFLYDVECTDPNLVPTGFWWKAVRADKLKHYTPPGKVPKDTDGAWDRAMKGI